jgi:hypothetical protein
MYLLLKFFVLLLFHLLYLFFRIREEFKSIKMLWVNLCGELYKLVFIEMSVNEFPANINSIFMFDLVVIVEEHFHQISFIDNLSSSFPKKHDRITLMNVLNKLALSIVKKILVLV